MEEPMSSSVLLGGGGALFCEASCSSLCDWDGFVGIYSLSMRRTLVFTSSVFCLLVSFWVQDSLSLWSSKRFSPLKGSNEAFLQNFLFSDSSQFYPTWANLLEIQLLICTLHFILSTNKGWAYYMPTRAPSLFWRRSLWQVSRGFGYHWGRMQKNDCIQSHWDSCWVQTASWVWRL